MEKELERKTELTSLKRPRRRPLLPDVLLIYKVDQKVIIER